MNKVKKALTAVAALMFSVCSDAQTVSQSVNGAIIDCSALKSDGFTKTKKARTTNGTNSTDVTESAADIGSKINNEKIYYKLEVSGTDNGHLMDWKGAIDLCAGITIDGGGWRLPTQRELVLVWVLENELKKIPGFGELGASIVGYRSATQHSWSHSWVVTLDFSEVVTINKAYPCIVRCVRDL